MLLWKTCCLALPMLLLVAGSADARCTSPADSLRFARSVTSALRCAEQIVSAQRGRSECTVQTPPQCAAAAFDAIVDLTTGALPASARSAPERSSARALRHATPEARCQRAVLRETRRYLRQRVPERLRGVRAAPREPLLEGVAESCAGVVPRWIAGGRIPGVAGACAPLYRDHASPDAATLGRCLVASVEGSIDRAMPHALRPNLVLILTDDQRADSLEFMPTTLERLAERGMRFDNGFVTTPVCGPSRASILTGQFASRHGILTNADLPLPGENAFEEDRSVGRWLQSVGYRTAFLGKYINGDAARPPRVPLGWDDWQAFRGPRYYNYTLNVNGELEDFGEAPEEYSTDLLAARAAEFIDESREGPFLLVLAPFAPHLPAIAADRHVGIFADLEPARPPSFQEPDLSGKPQWVRFVRSFGEPPEQIDALRIAQLETLPAVDDAVATLLDSLERLGLTDNTAVVFTSDNGYHWGEHWWTSKFTGYEESLRVPYVVRYPVAQPVAGRSDAPVLNIDLAPTFADLAGVAPMLVVDGESFRPLLAGLPSRREDMAFETYDSFIVRPVEGVRDARHKLIVTSPTSEAPFEELYDLEEDPFELANHAADPVWADTLERLRARLLELLPD